MAPYILLRVRWQTFGPFPLYSSTDPAAQQTHTDRSSHDCKIFYLARFDRAGHRRIMLRRWRTGSKCNAEDAGGPLV